MRMKNKLWLALILAGSAVTTLPAVAQQKIRITAPADQPYRFKHSGLTIPVTLEDMPRVGIDQFGTEELDVFANYERGREALTVYVYRNVSGAVPVWFDRAKASIEQRRDAYGDATVALAPTAFTPPGQNVASGLMGAWSVSKPPYRGTALVLLPLGDDWLVKIRYSSATLDGAAVAARLPAILAALTWPTGLAAAAPAQPIADCATPLAFPKKAKIVRDQEALSMSALLGGVLQSAAANSAKEQKASGNAAESKPPLWCRDPGPSPIGGVYRADAATDAYLLAFSDAGRGASVSPDTLGAMLDKKGAPRWSVSLIDMAQSSTYPPFTALPRPAEVLAMIQQPALSQASTWGERTQINLNAGAFGSKR